jgi:hypothetical protein
MRDRYQVVVLSLAAVCCSGGDDDEAAAGRGSEATCQQVYDNAAAQCPDGPWPPVAECEDNAAELESIGCAAWDAWLSCAAEAAFTCEGLYGECEPHWAGVAQCRAMQASTGCVRITSVDDQCDGATPFAFACLTGMPAGSCTPLETSAAIPYFCCAGM